MNKCFVCKKFDYISNNMGICTDTGERVGIDNSCRDCLPDAVKQENIMEMATKIYFSTNKDMKEAVRAAIEFYK